ncbi:MAG: GrpB family protein [Clostridiales bacterium]
MKLYVNTTKNGFKQNLTKYIRIEHIGSTSIPDMAAKPIIDIDIEISSIDVFNTIKNELEKIGYIHKGNQGIDGREVFKRTKTKKCILDEIDHHLYVCASGNQEYKNHLLFRDKLKSNKALVAEYKNIKYEILEKVGAFNRKGYVEMKENNYKDFFNSVLSE